MALRNSYRAYHSRHQHIAGKERSDTTVAASSSSSSAVKDRDEAEFMEKARQEFLREKAAREKFEELVSRVFGVVIGVGRRGVDGLPLDMKEDEYMKRHFDEEAKDAVVQYDGASSIVLSPVAPARQLGGVSAVYPADTSTVGFSASLLVSEKHPFGVIAVFDFDVAAPAQKTVRRLRSDYEKLMEDVRTTMLVNDAPETKSYSPEGHGLPKPPPDCCSCPP